MKNSDNRIDILSKRLSRITTHSHDHWCETLEYIAENYNTVDILNIFMDIKNDNKLYDRVISQLLVLGYE